MSSGELFAAASNDSSRTFVCFLTVSFLFFVGKHGVRSHGIGDLKLPFSLFLALRYLKPKRTFLSMITLISIMGVMLGVTVLIVVISVMSGFDQELRQKVIDFNAHVVVTAEESWPIGASCRPKSTRPPKWWPRRLSCKAR